MWCANTITYNTFIKWYIYLGVGGYHADYGKFYMLVICTFPTDNPTTYITKDTTYTPSQTPTMEPTITRRRVLLQNDYNSSTSILEYGHTNHNNNYNILYLYEFHPQNFDEKVNITKFDKKMVQ